MRITIIQDDGVVGVDGVSREVDLSALDPAIHAIQFDTLEDAGHIEYGQEATVDVSVRDLDAERAAEEAAATPEAVAALAPIHKIVPVRRGNDEITDFAPYQVYVDLWTRAAPPPPQPPTAEQIEDADIAALRAAALRALEEQRLAQAMADPAAPQAVKDYKAALEQP